MSLEHCCQKWVQVGRREQKRQERDTNLPNAISTDDWNSLVAHAKSKTLTALREPIRTAAKKSQVLVQGKRTDALIV